MRYFKALIWLLCIEAIIVFNFTIFHLLHKLLGGVQ